MAEQGVNLAPVFLGAGLPWPEAEYHFAPPRQWAFDWAWTVFRVAMEIEGGLFGRGKRCPVCGQRKVAGHGSIQRKKTDLEKYNAAAVRGWCVVRVIPDQVQSGEYLRLVEEALKARGWRAKP